MAMIKVTAGPGRTVPVHHSIATAPGAQLLYVREGDVLEVDDSNTLVQITLRDGDFVRIPDAAPTPAPADPIAPPKTDKAGKTAKEG